VADGDHVVNFALYRNDGLNAMLCAKGLDLGVHTKAGYFSVPLPQCIVDAVAREPNAALEVFVDGTSMSPSPGTGAPIGAVPYALEANHALVASDPTPDGGLSAALAQRPASPSATPDAVAWAKVHFVSTGVYQVTAQSGGWLSVGANAAVGKPVLSFASGAFSAAPACTCTPTYQAGGALCAYNGAATASGVTVALFDNAGNLQDDDFDLVCFGSR
jgi:hypothetical protein